MQDRTEAKRQGLHKYLPSDPCARGHISQRYVKTDLCLECNRENATAVYAAKKAARLAEKAKTFVSNQKYAGLPQKRATAKKVSSMQYYTGQPCLRGHVAPRFTGSGSCTICVAELNRGYIEKDPIKYAVAAKSRSMKRIPKRNEESRNWRLRNKERVSEYNAAYRAAHWADVATARASTLAARTPKWANLAAISEKYAEAKKLTVETGTPYHVDHIIPLHGPLVCGLHVESNLTVLTGQENLAKARSFEGSTPSSAWRELDDAGKDAFAKATFVHFRDRGFPYFAEFTKPIDQVIFSARNSLKKGLIVGDVVKRSPAGIDLANSFFPHMFDVRCNGLKTPLEAFNDDATLVNIIEYRMRYGDYMSDGGLRKAICTYSGVQRASNFRPTAAAALYEMFAGRNAKVFDPCAGWGGRLVGAAMAKNVSKYVGCDPSIKTFEGLSLLKEKVSEFVNSEILNCGIEDVGLGSQDFDMGFTSPPYFAHEQYADEPTQSCVKYPTKDQWRAGFLRAMFSKTYSILRPGAVFAVNIANVQGYRELEAHTVEEAIAAGFTYEKTMKLALAAMGSEKYEPVFIFRKPSGQIPTPDV